MPEGRVETGGVKPGMVDIFAAVQLVNEVKYFEMNHEPMPEAVLRDNVSLNIKNINVKDIKRRYVTADSKSKPATGVRDITTQVIVLSHSVQESNIYSPVLNCYTAHIVCKFADILEKIFIVYNL